MAVAMNGKLYTTTFKAEAITQALTISSKRHELTGVPDAPMFRALGKLLSLAGAKHASEIPQCGYCQSGQIMSAVALTAMKSAPA